MIRKASIDDMDLIEAYIAKDYARNYFIAMGLLSQKIVFKDIYIWEDPDVRGILFHRKSGNLQYVSYDHGNPLELLEFMKGLNFDTLISPRSYCKPLESILKIKQEGAIIGALKKETYKEEVVTDLKTLSINDLDQVIQLYQKVFPGYPKKDYMKEKLESKRGIGVYIDHDGIQSLAQSDFYNIIVGVATNPDYQNKGFASKCLHGIIQRLFEDQETLYLQYDNPEAGRIYERIGFKPVDQVFHYQKR